MGGIKLEKKGQAAMEFLMTYGWAILVVLIAIGALAYFGVLNPSRFLPASCTLMPGLSCDSFKVTPTSVELVVRNGMGDDLTGLGFSTASCATDAQANTTLNDGDTVKHTLTCAPLTGSRFKEDVTITYSNVVGTETVTHSRTGQIVTEIEGA